VAAASLGSALHGAAAPATAPAAEPSAAKLPRWRGFNLLEKFKGDRRSPFKEQDFEWVAGWGFDFVRLPMSYHCWSSAADPRKIDEGVLKEIDQAVEWGRQYRVHVNINFHRAPGFCVNPPKEPLDLWTDETALGHAMYHWGVFAQRYKGIPNARVSFDLLNEPPDIAEEKYVRVARRLVEAIRAVDPARLIVADGIRWGNTPVHGLADLGVAQSTRGYAPMQISHHKASWIKGSETWPTPAWPMRASAKDVWDKDRLRRAQIAPWQALAAKGVGVHVGEWGAFNQTPHDAALAWMRDNLDLWKEAGWGWALWNLRGSFGIVDSGRKDVAYEDFKGRKLDRKMLELLLVG